MSADTAQTARDAASPDFRILLREAEALLRAGRVEEAESLYRRVLVLRPREIEALRGHADCARRRGDGPAALHWREAVRDARPDSALAWTDLGRQLRELGRTEDAEEAYRRAVALKPNDPRAVRALLGLAACARARGDRDAALVAWSAAAVAAAPHEPSVREVASSLRAAKEHDHAAGVFARLLAAQPDSAEAALGLGLAERARRRHKAARDAFLHLLTRRPDDLGALLESAGEERTLGRTDEAAALLHRLLALDPGHAAARRQMAGVLKAKEGEAEAIAWLRADIAARPAPRELRLCLVQMLADAGETEAALAELDAAESAAPPDTETRLKRVGLLQRSGELARACALAREAVALDPASLPAWRRCVELAIAVGDWAEAERHLERPPNGTATTLALAHRFRGLVAMGRWRAEEAIGHFRQALATDPDDAAVHVYLARAHLAALEPEAAMDHVRAWARTRRRGASAHPGANPRYTFEGRMVEEYTLDREALAALRAAWTAPAGWRVEELCRLLREPQDSTGAAISLLRALRAEGRIGAAIPRRIVQYWAGSEPPPSILALAERWKAINPGFEHVLVTDREVEVFLGEQMRAALPGQTRPRLSRPQMADLFRFADLHARGGVYVDAAARPVGPLAPLLPDAARLVLVQSAQGHVETGLLAAAPGHPVLARVFRMAVEAIARGDMDTRWLATGPGLLTRALAAEIAASPGGPEAALRGIVLQDATRILREVAGPAEMPRGVSNPAGGLLMP